MATIVNNSEEVRARVRGRLAPVFVGHDIYRQAGYTSNHPLGIARVGPVMDLCDALGWLPAEEFNASPRATEAELTRFHHPDYVAALRNACLTGRVESAVR